MCLIFFTCFVHFFIINDRRLFPEALGTSVFGNIWNRQTDGVVSVSCCSVRIQTLNSCQQKRYIQFKGSTWTIRQNKAEKLQQDSKHLSAEYNTGLSTFLPLQTLSKKYSLFCTLRREKILVCNINVDLY